MDAFDIRRDDEYIGIEGRCGAAGMVTRRESDAKRPAVELRSQSAAVYGKRNWDQRLNKAKIASRSIVTPANDASGTIPPR